MSENTIIDVHPVDQRREGTAANAGATQQAGGQAPNAGTAAGAGATPGAGAAAGAGAQQAAAKHGAQQGSRYYTFVDAEHGDATWKGTGAGASAQKDAHAGAGAAHGAAQAAGTGGAAPSAAPHAPAPTYVKAEVIGKDDRRPADSAAGGRAGGVVQMAVGGAIAAVGIPMLVLPGPGLLAIGGGLALAANGARKALGKKK